MKKLYLIGLVLLSCSDLSSQVRKMSAIGSSTTGGTGAFPADSAWVRRFSLYYKNQLGILDSAYNRGVGGYNCYKGMPTGYVPPPGRDGPDPNNNITKALADLNDLPVKSNGVIIINYPTNNYPEFTIAEIMFCLQTMYDLAITAGHKCYITTTQPRTDGSYGTSANKKKLADIKDSIINRFGVANSLNFYDGMINPADSTILPIYSAGDNTHFNNAGHRILFQRVVAKDVFNIALPVKLEQFSATNKNGAVELRWIAHHDDPQTRFVVQRSADGFQFESLQTIQADNSGHGNRNYQFDDKHPLSGSSFYRLEIQEGLRKDYSSTITVRLQAPQLVIKKLYPTRVTQMLTLEIESPELLQVSLEIISSSGARLHTFTRQLYRNHNIINLPVAGLPGGSYFLRINYPGTGPVIQTFVK